MYHTDQPPCDTWVFAIVHLWFTVEHNPWQHHGESSMK